jgi:hypothetical protein
VHHPPHVTRDAPSSIPVRPTEVYRGGAAQQDPGFAQIIRAQVAAGHSVLTGIDQKITAAQHKISDEWDGDRGYPFCQEVIKNHGNQKLCHF